MHLDPEYAKTGSFQDYIKALAFFRDPKITKVNISERSLDINGNRYKMGLYGSLVSRIEELRCERARLVSEYRWLLNALLYSRSGVAPMREQVDNVATTLHSISLEIQGLEAFKAQVLDTDGRKRVLKRQRAELVRQVRPLDGEKRVLTLDKLHTIDREVKMLVPSHVDSYPIELPQHTRIRTKRTKTHKGGQDPKLEQLERIKRAVLQRFGRKNEGILGSSMNGKLENKHA